MFLYLTPSLLNVLSESGCVARQKFRQIFYRGNQSVVMPLTQDEEVHSRGGASKKGNMPAVNR